MPLASAQRAETYEDLLRQAREAIGRSESRTAISLATRAIRREPKRKEAYALRAALWFREYNPKAAAGDYAALVKLDPSDAYAWQEKGEADFAALRFAESVADFDAFLKRRPDRKAHHWQRGISLYYAGRFAEGKAQFELHRTVNPEDVENAVWHFLCNARLNGIDAARRELIPIRADARAPMAQIQRLFAGEGSEEDVLAAARSAAQNSQGGEPLFYAHLYLGLYYEASGHLDRACSHIAEAATRAKRNGYMGIVARVHALLSKPRPEKKRPTAKENQP